jgi:hypothetical protein
MNKPNRNEQIPIAVSQLQTTVGSRLSDGEEFGRELVESAEVLQSPRASRYGVRMSTEQILIGPKNAGLRRYSTGLCSIDTGERPKPPYVGQGWEIGVRFYQHIGKLGLSHKDATRTIEFMDTEHGLPRWRTAPELVIFAPNCDSAQRAANLLFAAMVVFDGQLFLIDEIVAVPEDKQERDEYPSWQFADETGPGAAEHFSTAGALAARLSRRRPWQYAAMKLLASHRFCSIPRRDGDPHGGSWYGVERDPAKHVAFAYAIIAAYSSIEELGLEIRASEKKPSKIHGEWNPLVRKDLEERLQKARVDIARLQFWHVRNPPTRIEQKHGIPQGSRLGWSRGLIRDRKTLLIDAILHASFLRSKVSSHRVSHLAPSLTVMDVLNVQGLARRLLLECTGFIPGEFRNVAQEHVQQWAIAQS